jgi:hypothetical protein
MLKHTVCFRVPVYNQVLKSILKVNISFCTEHNIFDRLLKRVGFKSLCSTGALTRGAMLHTNNLNFNLVKINQRVNARLNFQYLLFE